MRKHLLGALVAIVVVFAAPAGRAAVAVTVPGGFVAGFLPPVVVVAEGEGVTFANGDIAPHNFIAADTFYPRKAAKKVKWCSGYPAGKCPLFWSPTIGLGESVEVLGLDKVKSGEQYAFVCSVHPNMRGTLIVR